MSHWQYHQVLVSPQIGGAGLTGLRLARSLCEQGEACQVWVPARGPMYEEAVAVGQPVQTFDGRGAMSRGKLRPALANGRMGWRLRRFGPGVVHVHSPFFYRALRIGLRLAPVKTVAHVQIQENEDGLRWAFHEPPDLIVTCARFLIECVRRNLPEHLRERQAIVAVPNAVDTDQFRPPEDKTAAKRRVDAPADAPLLLMLANLAPHKGQETAIRLVTLLKDRGVKIHCWLAGEEREQGGYESRLVDLIRDLGVGDRVRLLGQRSDAPALLQAADFFLLPSSHEGLPLSILEAQATRVPVLAGPTAGVPEIVRDGITGFLIAPDDVRGYAGRIETLMANRNLSSRMTQEAYAQATGEYNWNSFVTRMTDLYLGLRGTEPSGCRGERQFAMGHRARSG